jgi:hypothetical protein
MTKKLTPVRLSLDNTFDVIVGTSEPHKQKRFTLHTNLLIPRSGFFKAARSAVWNTDPLKPAILDDDDPEVFENYMRCVYSGDLDPHPYDSSDGSNSIDDGHLDALSKIWVLADKLIDLQTANMNMDEIYNYCNKMEDFARNSSFNLVYDSTVSDSPLRMFMRDTVIYNHHGIVGFFEHEDPSDYHVEFYRDIAVRLMCITNENRKSSRTFKGIFGGGVPSHMPPSNHYHLHGPAPSSK